MALLQPGCSVPPLCEGSSENAGASMYSGMAPGSITGKLLCSASSDPLTALTAARDKPQQSLIQETSTSADLTPSAEEDSASQTTLSSLSCPVTSELIGSVNADPKNVQRMLAVEQLTGSALVALDEDLAIDDIKQIEAVYEASNRQPVTKSGKVSPFQKIREGHIGRAKVVETPFGSKTMVYADYAASGRLLKPIEDYMAKHVYPYYANVHSDTGVCATVSAAHVAAARGFVATTLAAPEADFACIFTGSGVTGAIAKLAHLLGVERANRSGWRRPVVMVSIMEHHSNCVQWRELDCELVVIPVNQKGRLDLKFLKTQLRAHANAPLILGSFSAGSNVTGTTPGNLRAIARLLHQHGAIVAFDCASAACCSAIECQPSGCPPEEAFDAVYLSPHKLPGGPGACGVLVIRRSIVRQKTPQIAGGGTVQFVNGEEHFFLESIEAREEGGTPNIIGCIRAGLALRLQKQLDPHLIHRAGLRAVKRAIDAWSLEPNIHVIGSHYAAAHDSDRLSLISFNVSAPAVGKLHARGMARALLHAHFVAAVLNDVFGIQARAGCSCAGPWGLELLRNMMRDMGAWDPEALKTTILKGHDWMKPGWVRVNFNHLMSDEEVSYIIDAVIAVARYGFHLLPQYRFAPKTGLFSHGNNVDHEADVSIALRGLFDRFNAAYQTLRKGVLLHTPRRASKPAWQQNAKRAGKSKGFRARISGLARVLRCAVDSSRAELDSSYSQSLETKQAQDGVRTLTTAGDDCASDATVAHALVRQRKEAQDIFDKALEDDDALKEALEWPEDDSDYRHCEAHHLRAFLLPHEAAEAMLSKAYSPH